MCPHTNIPQKLLRSSPLFFFVRLLFLSCRVLLVFDGERNAFRSPLSLCLCVSLSPRSRARALSLSLSLAGGKLFDLLSERKVLVKREDGHNKVQIQGLTEVKFYFILLRPGISYEHVLYHQLWAHTTI